MGRRWCEIDGELKIGAAVGRLVFTVPFEQKMGASLVRVVVGVPAGAEVKASRNPELGAPVELTVEAADALAVAVLVEAPDDFPLAVRFGPAGSHDLPALVGVGQSNERIELGPPEAA
jgi:hypothetical protein